MRTRCNKNRKPKKKEGSEKREARMRMSIRFSLRFEKKIRKEIDGEVAIGVFTRGWIVAKGK